MDYRPQSYVGWAMADCVEIVSKAMNGASEKELDQIFTRVDNLIKEQEGLKSGEILEKLNKNIKDDALSKKIEARNTALNAFAYRTGKQFTDGFDKKELGVEALLVGIHGKMGSRRSAAAMQDMMSDTYMSRFTADMEGLGNDAFDIFATGSLDDDVARALWAKTMGREVEVDPTAKKIAEVINTWQEISRIDANKAGAWIRKLPGYIVRQSHDMDKIRKAGFEEWRQLIEPLLDESTFAGVKDRTAFLESVHKGLESGVHLGDGTIPGLKGFGNVGKSMSQERVLHFKDADGWINYNKRFGYGNIREAVMGGLRMSGQKTGLMKVLGPKPELTYQRIVDDYMGELRGTEGLDGFKDASEGKLDNFIKMITGQTNIPGNQMWAGIFQVDRGLASLQMLGKAVVSSVADVPISASELRHNGIGFFSRQGMALNNMGGAFADIGRSLANRKLTVKDQATRRALSELSIALDSTTGSFTARFDMAGDSIPGRTSKAVQTFFRWNGLTLWTDSIRAGSIIGIANHIGRLANKSHQRLPALLKKNLEQYGIGADEWNLIRSAGTRKFDGNEFLTPESVKDIDKSQLTKYLQDRNIKSTDYQINKLRDDLTDSMRIFYVDRSQHAVLEPDAKTRATFFRDLQPGTVYGEAARSFAQFKTFPATIIQKVWGRELKNNVSTLGSIGGMAEVMIMSTLYGYLAMTAKDLIANKTPKDPEKVETWMAAWLQGGAAGIYGDFLFGKGTENRYGTSFVGTAAGPMASQIEEIVDIFAAAKDGDDKAFDKFFRTAYQNAPGLMSMVYPPASALNSAYAKAVLDHMIYYNIVESLSPGYKRRMERRIKKEFDQELLIK